MNPNASVDIVFDNVSKFYGEVLGVNRVHLSIPAGITSLVGPNGSGKTTLMNLMTGLLQPTEGSISVLGVPPSRPDELFHRVGYCTQYDSFPRGLNGYQFVHMYLQVHGYDGRRAHELTMESLEQVNLVEASKRRIAAYSKGMRQRIKLAQAIAHQPTVLVLDEPLNGLDPMARAEIIDLFQKLAERGLHVIISSHILHEVDLISERVILLNEGYVVAEGDIRSVRGEIQRHPLRIMIRCDNPAVLATEVVAQDHIVEIKMHDDRQGLLISTRDPDRFYKSLNRVVLDRRLAIEAVTPADEDVHAVYRYLIDRQSEAMT